MEVKADNRIYEISKKYMIEHKYVYSDNMLEYAGKYSYINHRNIEQLQKLYSELSPIFSKKEISILFNLILTMKNDHAPCYDGWTEHIEALRYAYKQTNN